MKTYILLLTYLLISIQLFSQINNGLTAPEIIPKSPEVAGLERYGEYPVSEYTGIPSINIPIYSIKAKDIELPISLNYHATGIKVSQEATWVGLGWNLLVGGSISVLPVGSVDRINYSGRSDWERLLDYNRSISYSPDYLARGFPEEGINFAACVPPASPMRTTDNMLRDALYGSGERDIYNVNFLGKSFRFSKHPYLSNYVYNGEKNKYKIEKTGHGWRITDDQGYIYTFNALEGVEQEDFTWHLTDIHYQWKPLLKISYEHNIFTTPLQKSIDEAKAEFELQSPSTALILKRDVIYPRRLNQIYPSSIVGILDSVVFTTKNRIDINGGFALDEIKVLDRSSKEIRKWYKFEHDYFTGTNTGGTSTNINNDHYLKRLKLTKLDQKDGNNKKQTYSFDYNETHPLPHKTSFSQDYWGFYNNQRNMLVGTEFKGIDNPSKNYTLIPDPVVLSLNESVTNNMLNLQTGESPFITFANRRASKNHITAGLLKSITYPTGGRTEFKFEPHVFNNYFIPDANVDGAGEIKNVIVSDYGIYPIINHVQFILEEESRVQIKGTIKGLDVHYLTKMQEFNIDVYLNGVLKKSYFVCKNDEENIAYGNGKREFAIEDVLTLQAGNVEVRTTIPTGYAQPNQNRNGIGATISYLHKDIKNLKNAESIGGGLRIEKITNYTYNNEVASIIKYKYITSNGKTSGKLLNPMKFSNISNYYTFDKELIRRPAEQGGDYYITNKKSIQSHEVSSSNLYNYSASGCDGIVVGYSRVEIETISAAENIQNGKKVFEFINEPNSGSGNKFFIASDPKSIPLNGKQTASIVLNNNNDTIRKENYDYSVQNFESNLINLWAEDKYRGYNIQCQEFHPEIYIGNGDRFNLMLYPTNSYTLQLNSHSTSDYYGGNKVSTTTSYEYDPLNYQVKKRIETLGDKTKATEYKYVLNNTSTADFIRNIMIEKNMIGIPIEETHYLNSTLILSKFTNYWWWNNDIDDIISPIAPSYVESHYGDESLKYRLDYLKYNSFFNPIELSLDDADKVVYLWGYNHQYPIAKIEGASYSDVVGAISGGAGTITTLETASEPNMASVNALRNSLPNALVTTYTYKPLVGIETMTDPRGVLIKYEYDDFDRLKWIADKDGNIIESYEYKYKNQ